MTKAERIKEYNLANKGYNITNIKKLPKSYNKLKRISTDTGICGTYVTFQLEDDDLDKRIHYSNRENDL